MITQYYTIATDSISILRIRISIEANYMVLSTIIKCNNNLKYRDNHLRPFDISSRVYSQLHS